MNVMVTKVSQKNILSILCYVHLNISFHHEVCIINYDKIMSNTFFISNQVAKGLKVNQFAKQPPMLNMLMQKILVGF